VTPRLQHTASESSLESGAVLTLNAGSSSIRYALYDQAEPMRRILSGKMDRIGSRETTLACTDSSGQQDSFTIDTGEQNTPVASLLIWLEQRQVFDTLKAVGHRVVHGMSHTGPETITPVLLDELRRIIPYAPEHLPRQIELIELIGQRHPGLPQVACFDTAFHHNMPRVARILPIPRRYEAAGVRRYGFHGLSYEFLMQELMRLGDPAATSGRVILAHLGNGASLAAVSAGHSIDTSMGFTPTGGLVMGSRPGDLDPGLVCWLASTEDINTAQLQQMLNHGSGLLGISETSADMRDLLAREDDDVRAAEAVALFCYQAKKWIGAYMTVLGGLDTLVFAGGIGENLPLVRARICAGLNCFGIELDPVRNMNNAALLSTDTAPVKIRVIHTDEEQMIANSVTRLLHPGTIK